MGNAEYMGSCGSATKQDAVGQWAEKAGTIVASLSLSLAETRSPRGSVIRSQT